MYVLGVEFSAQLLYLLVFLFQLHCEVFNCLFKLFALKRALLAGSDEVNVSTPTAAELQAINPYSFINIYKKGYTATLTKASYEGKSVHEVRLVTTSKNSNMPKILLTIDPTTLMPLSVRFKNAKGDWTRIRVRSIKTGRKFADAAFTFDAKQHPGIEVIDLR